MVWGDHGLSEGSPGRWRWLCDSGNAYRGRRHKGKLGWVELTALTRVDAR